MAVPSLSKYGTRVLVARVGNLGASLACPTSGGETPVERSTHTTPGLGPLCPETRACQLAQVGDGPMQRGQAHKARQQSTSSEVRV